jgi:hypothetical protein
MAILSFGSCETMTEFLLWWKLIRLFLNEENVRGILHVSLWMHPLSSLKIGLEVCNVSCLKKSHSHLQNGLLSIADTDYDYDDKPIIGKF